MKISVPFTLLSLTFCLCFIMDSFLDMKICNILGIPVPVGFFVFVLSYVVSDCITEVYGYKVARFLMWCTFGFHLLFIGLLQLACWLPPISAWEGEEHYQYIFGLAPRITIASMIAFLFGSSTNAYVMSRMKVSMNNWGFKARAFISTVFGETIDASLYFTIGFIGIYPLKDIAMLILTQSLGKITYEAVILPVTERVVKKVKKCENIDVYDEGISYSIFSLK